MRSALGVLPCPTYQYLYTTVQYISMEKYFKISATEDRQLAAHLAMKVDTADGFVIEEKVDGSQFRCERSADGLISYGSHNVDFTDDRVPTGGFAKAAGIMSLALRSLEGDRNHYMLFCEFLATPRHNALHYDRVPLGNLYLFDAKVNGIWLDDYQLTELAAKLNIEPPHVLARLDHFPAIEEIRPYLSVSSALGGSMEGVVIKHRGIQFISYSVPQFLAMKVVNASFKELNTALWKEEHRSGIHSIDDLIGFVMEGVKLPAVWLKASQHLKENGESTSSMRDIPKLIDLINEDIDTEYKEEIKDLLFDLLHRQITQKFTKGFAVWYKEKLVNDMAEALK